MNIIDFFRGGQKDEESPPARKLGLEIAKEEPKRAAEEEPKEEKAMESQTEPGKEESPGEAAAQTQDETVNEASGAQEPANVSEDETIEFKPFNPEGKPESPPTEEASQPATDSIEEEPEEEPAPETAEPAAEAESQEEPEAEPAEPAAEAESQEEPEAEPAEPEADDGYSKEEIEKERQALLQEEIQRTQAREREAMEENYIEQAEHSGISPNSAALMAFVALLVVMVLAVFGIKSFNVAESSMEEADNRYLALTSKIAEHKEPVLTPPAETSGISAELARSAATLDKIIALNDPELSPRASELKNEVNAAIAAIKAEPGDIQKAGAPQE